MLQRLSFIAFSGLAVALTTVPSLAQSAMRDVLEGMKKGGYVIVIRHGRTNESADTKDASPLDLSNCTGSSCSTRSARGRRRRSARPSRRLKFRSER